MNRKELEAENARWASSRNSLLEQQLIREQKSLERRQAEALAVLQKLSVPPTSREELLELNREELEVFLAKLMPDGLAGLRKKDRRCVI